MQTKGFGDFGAGQRRPQKETRALRSDQEIRHFPPIFGDFGQFLTIFTSF
jgi:hypothetical protein